MRAGLGHAFPLPRSQAEALESKQITLANILHVFISGVLSDKSHEHGWLRPHSFPVALQVPLHEA